MLAEGYLFQCNYEWVKKSNHFFNPVNKFSARDLSFKFTKARKEAVGDLPPSSFAQVQETSIPPFMA